MDRKKLLDCLRNRGVNLEKTPTIRTFLTNSEEEMFENGYIVALDSIEDETIDPIFDLSEILEKYIMHYWPETGLDFHYNSVHGCYFLSTLFALASDWTLVQGIQNIDVDHPVYHSWLEKDGIVYDPAGRIVTRKELYELFFDAKYRHSKQEIETFLKRTASFTYYVEDLEYGSINPDLKENLYDTPIAYECGERILSELKQFVERKGIMPKKFRTTLENEPPYALEDHDFTPKMLRKANVVAYAIAQRLGIPFQEAYIQYINSDQFHRLEEFDRKIFILSDQELIEDYFSSLEDFKQK